MGLAFRAEVEMGRGLDLLPIRSEAIRNDCCFTNLRPRVKFHWLLEFLLSLFRSCPLTSTKRVQLNADIIDNMLSDILHLWFFYDVKASRPPVLNRCGGRPYE